MKKKNISINDVAFHYVSRMMKHMSNIIITDDLGGKIPYITVPEKTAPILDKNFLEKQEAAYMSLLLFIRQIAYPVSNDDLINLEQIFQMFQDSFLVRGDIDKKREEFDLLKKDSKMTSLINEILYSDTVHAQSKTANKYASKTSVEKLIEQKSVEMHMLKIMDIAVYIAWLIQRNWLAGTIEVLEEPTAGKLLLFDFYRKNPRTGLSLAEQFGDATPYNNFILTFANDKKLQVIAEPKEDSFTLSTSIDIDGNLTMESIDYLINQLKALTANKN